MNRKKRPFEAWESKRIRSENTIMTYYWIFNLLAIIQMFDIDRLGIGKVMEETLDYLKDFDGLHLSYDIDALDPYIAPHTGTSVRGGLTYREGNFICEAMSATGRLRSMELVEVNPSLYQDIDPKLTIGTALSIVSSVMGRTIL